MVEAEVASALVVVEAELAFELPVVELDRPAQPGEPGESLVRLVFGEVREPVFRGCFGVLGRFGTAAIEAGAEHRAVLVPDSALVEDDLTGEIRLARVAPGSIAVWTPVRLGAAQPGHHELLAPALPPGTAVLVRGQRGLPDSTRVRVEP